MYDFMAVIRSIIMCCVMCAILRICGYVYEFCFLEFITGLLNNVGTHIDPTRLIQVVQIKDELFVSFTHDIL